MLSPLIGQLSAQAAGKSEFPQRFVFVVKSSGLTPGHIVPESFVSDYIIQKESYIAGEGYTSGVQLKDCDKFIRRPLKDATLNDSMKSLEPFKDRLTILQGLSGNMVTGGHMSGYGAMSCIKDLMAENDRPQDGHAVSVGLFSSRVVHSDSHDGRTLRQFDLLPGDFRSQQQQAIAFSRQPYAGLSVAVRFGSDGQEPQAVRSARQSLRLSRRRCEGPAPQSGGE